MYKFENNEHKIGYYMFAILGLVSFVLFAVQGGLNKLVTTFLTVFLFSLWFASMYLISDNNDRINKIEKELKKD